jgi:hypothetical protein
VVSTSGSSGIEGVSLGFFALRAKPPSLDGNQELPSGLRQPVNMGGVLLPFFCLRQKPASRATALWQRFFRLAAKTALPPLPALDDMIGRGLWLRQPAGHFCLLATKAAVPVLD